MSLSSLSPSFSLWQKSAKEISKYFLFEYSALKLLIKLLFPVERSPVKAIFLISESSIPPQIFSKYFFIFSFFIITGDNFSILISFSPLTFFTFSL